MRPRSATLWRNSDFRKLWIGQTISEVGSRITLVGLPLAAVLVLKATPFQMGLLAGVGGLASLLFGPVAGLCVDRTHRRLILIVSDLGRAALLGSIPLAAARGVLSMQQVYVVVAAAGILTVLFDIAYQAYLPSLVDREHIMESNSKLALSNSIAEIAGPGLTGVLVDLLTAPVAILFDALSFIGSAVTVWLIRKPEPVHDPVSAGSPHVWKDLTTGIRILAQSPIRRAIAGHSATAGFFGGFFASLYVLFALKSLHLSSALIGAVIALGGVGNLIGAALASRLIRQWGLGATLIGSTLVMGTASFMIPLARGSILVATAFLVAAQLGDICWPVYHVGELSLRQIITPDHLLGRVNAAMQTLSRGLLPLGSFCGGLLGDMIGVRPTLAFGAAGLLLSSFWLVFSPIRAMREYPNSDAL